MIQANQNKLSKSALLSLFAEQGLGVKYHDHIAQGNIATANLIAK